MPTATYTPLATITLGSSASSVTFSNIPNTYRDLILVVNGVASNTGDPTIKLNNSSADFNWSQIIGTGSSIISNAVSNNSLGKYSTTRFNLIINLQDYAANKHKIILARSSAPGDDVRFIAMRWAQTTAVNSLTFGCAGSDTFSQSSTFALYGVIA